MPKTLQIHYGAENHKRRDKDILYTRFYYVHNTRFFKIMPKIHSILHHIDTVTVTVQYVKPENYLLPASTLPPRQTCGAVPFALRWSIYTNAGIVEPLVWALKNT